jgi:hypothetical protein
MVEGINSFLENIVTVEPYYFENLVKKSPRYKRLEVSWILFHINASKLLFQEEKQIILPKNLKEELLMKEIPENLISYYISQLKIKTDDLETYNLLNEAITNFFSNEELMRNYNTLKHKHLCSKFYNLIVKDLETGLNQSK